MLTWSDILTARNALRETIENPPRPTPVAHLSALGRHMQGMPIPTLRWDGKDLFR